MIRFATKDEISRWDELVLANPDGGNVLQLKAFIETKSRHGWSPRYLIWNKIAVAAIARAIPVLGEFWYVPNGPGVNTSSELKKFAAEVNGLEGKRPFAIKLDPLIDGKKPGAPFMAAPRHIQYNTSTIIVDLAPDEEDILASFKQKTRYNIRLAAKKGVTVEAVDTDQYGVDTMYALTESMTERAKVYLRPKAYFEDFWMKHAASGHGQMFFAKYEGKVLAGAFVTHVGDKALYKDGGSIREHSEVQAPYALQWEAMRWLKARGVTSYDLHGVPPASQINNPDHPLAGLARFKTGFNPEVTEFIGTYDLPLNKVNYHLWRLIGERLAVAYEYRFKNQLFY